LPLSSRSFASRVVELSTTSGRDVRLQATLSVIGNAHVTKAAGVAGSTRLGRGVVFAARAGALGHLDVGDGVILGADALLTEDAAPGERRSGVPAIPHRRWLRVAASLPELPELLATVRRLEADVARLQAALKERT
jgi:UDP-3-O-[3-hydroxymyristoyl] glucosamine N-acyltransferase